MSKMIFLFLLACSSATLIGCKKKQEKCDTATLCVVNNTSDTIRYCWGCSVFSEKVAPGQKACREVRGPISDGSSVWVDFMTASETRRIEVDKCNVEVYWQ
jgi:hypothetical protein